MGEQLEAERLSLQATTPPADIPGYRMEKFLGAGAFGQVWVGRDLNTGRRVAIKFYLHRGGVNWSLLAREVKHLVQLSADRYIVQVLGVGWDANPPYYVMEYLESGSLEDLLAAQGRMPVGQAVELFHGICTGLNHSHGKGVLHCDLKPANVLLDEDLRPRLADFGQSRMSNEQTPALGTLFYMAPEQANLDAAPDARWDVYALGAILYRILTGNAPHRSSALLQRIDTAGTLPKRLEQYRQAILRDGPPQDHHGMRGVDSQLSAIIDGCLAVDPDKRFGNVQQVLEALERRKLDQQRRPLFLLGIVGPLLLLLMTCVLTTRTVLETRGTVEKALREKAKESNDLAAMFASRTLELELREYFELVLREAHDENLLFHLREALDNPELTKLRMRIAENDDAAKARLEWMQSELTQPLRNALNQRLKLYDGRKTGTGSIDLATMFIVDSHGTIVSISYENPVTPDENSIAKNFAFRAYFHGGREDLPSATDPFSVRPLQRTHLSPAFFSTATQTWKMAVSTPIYFQSPVNKNATPDAIFVATTNLGDFDLMRANQEQNVKVNQIAVLVDSRPGDKRGTIIQHPLIDRPQISNSTDPDAIEPYFVNNNTPAVAPETLDALLAGTDDDYTDPMGALKNGQQYRGPWIAAVQPVSLPQIERGDEQETTDLLVLVQYRWSEVIAPVGDLARKLIAYGAVAVVGILVVIFLMWYLVRRVGDDSRPAGPINQSLTRTGNTETLPAR